MSQSELPAFRIFVDGDGCPGAVKDIVFRAGAKRKVPVVVVANHAIRIPESRWISRIGVPKGLDEADDWIAEHVGTDDIVITGDIPLAARIVEHGATGIDFRGGEYTDDNVRERLSVRDFMHELREAGVETGGAPPWSPKDTQRFANSLDRLLTRRGQ